MDESYKNKFKDKKIIVTGGLGFVGSNLVRKLYELEPKKIVVIDSQIKDSGGDLGNISDLKDASFLHVPWSGENPDIGNRFQVEKYVEDSDYIFNLAGSVRHIDSKNSPLDDLRINLVSHVSFLETCRKVFPNPEDKKMKILFSATRDVYGKTTIEDLPIREDFIVRDAADPQGIHNHSAEFHHLWYARNFGFDAVSLRLTNTYGPRQKIDDPGQGFLGYFIHKALSGETIELWGGRQRA